MNILRISVTDEQGIVVQEPRVTDSWALPEHVRKAVEHSSFVKCEYTYKLPDGVKVTLHIQRMIEIPSTLFYEPYNAYILEARIDSLYIHFTLSCGHTCHYHYRNTEETTLVAQIARGKECQCEQCSALVVRLEVSEQVDDDRH